MRQTFTRAEAVHRQQVYINHRVLGGTLNKNMKKFDPSKRKRWNRAVEGFYLSILDRSVLRFRIKPDSFGGYGVWYTPHGTNTESERTMFFKQCVGWLVQSSPQIWNNLVRDGERSSLFEVKGKENMWMLGMLSLVNHSCNAALSWNKLLQAIYEYNGSPSGVQIYL